MACTVLARPIGACGPLRENAKPGLALSASRATVAWEPIYFTLHVVVAADTVLSVVLLFPLCEHTTNDG